ncbi:MAG: ComF family protein [Austwickia sp.]|nr:ComF family protein [Actinomycetota bacterium]MCB1253740.1 ComF family protein [Austwickia sp.]MCO5309178.1 ComF family protein [Austwickia sp.]
MRWHDAITAALELGLPVCCAGCARPGVGWCRTCQAEVATAWGAPRPVRPSPCPDDFPPTWAAAPYEGPLRSALAAYKDDGRRDLARPLARLLGEAVQTSHPTPGSLLVPVPTTAQARRRRGDAPLLTLLHGAARSAAELRAQPSALTTRRVLADSAGLTIAERAANLAGAFVATCDLAGADVVLLDDVVTTGATLCEATRALRAAGARSVTAACIAATTRRRLVAPGCAR